MKDEELERFERPPTRGDVAAMADPGRASLFLEHFKLAVSLVRALAWPATILILVFSFHKDIVKVVAGLAERLETAEVGGQKLSFGGSRPTTGETIAGPRPPEIWIQTLPMDLPADDCRRTSLSTLEAENYESIGDDGTYASYGYAPEYTALILCDGVKKTATIVVSGPTSDTAKDRVQALAGRF